MGKMVAAPQEGVCRRVAEWALTSDRAYANPFGDLVVDGMFTAPSGEVTRMPAFFDGDGTWRLRFSPNASGEWRVQVTSRPHDPALEWEGPIAVSAGAGRGFLRATPGEAWGLTWESGEPAFILGDTTYNLFGMSHCGADVEGFMRRRAAQGFNLLRVRLPVSPFHPPQGYSDWQTRRTWPWGGSEQSPLFDRFNLEYFRTVDRVVALADELGLGLEMIMEGWGFEFPFSHRDLFVPEWEELWMRYLVARYDAYGSVAIWTLQNEYEYYPDGDWRYNPVADRWAMRMGRWLKATAPHGHIVAVHNGPRLPAFADRFALDPQAIDLILYQTWGTRDRERGWLAAGIDEEIAASLARWPGSAVFAEWGYERNPDLPLHIPSHEYCDAEHTRRGAWRGVFSGLGIIHGFENSWGPFMDLEHDQPGLEHLLTLRRFCTDVVPFYRLSPAPKLLVPQGDALPEGHRPLVMGEPSQSVVVVYLPVGGRVRLAVDDGPYQATWFSPVNGKEQIAPAEHGGYTAPAAEHAGHPQDWALVLRRFRP